MRLSIYIFALFVLVNSSCQNQDKQSNNTSQSQSFSKIKYAKGFNIEYFADYKLVTVFNPWEENTIYNKYRIYYKDTSVSLTGNELVCSIIKDKIITLSGSQIGFLGELNLTDKIIAVSKKEYIFNKTIIEKINSNKIIELGDESNLNFEKIYNINPNMLFTTGWNTTNSSYNKIAETGIPVIYLLEWQENNPLGRAEWIKFIAAFLNKDKEADSIFSIIEHNYISIKNSLNTKKRPNILHGSLIGGTWYIPGGNSYIANLYKDAGTNYLWSDNEKTGSLPLKFESVYNKAKNADFWFPMLNINTTEELLNNEERYSLFNTVKSKKIFLANKMITKYGGNDYWEKGVARPDLILNDLVHIFSNDSLNNDELFFFKQIY